MHAPASIPTPKRRVLLDEVRVPRDRIWRRSPIATSSRRRHLGRRRDRSAAAGPSRGRPSTPVPASSSAADRSVPGIKHKLADLPVGGADDGAAWDAALALDTGKPARRDWRGLCRGTRARRRWVGKDLIQVLGDRLHLGARRPRLPPARHDLPVARCSVGAVLGWRSSARRHEEVHGRRASHPRRQRRASASATGRAGGRAPLESTAGSWRIRPALPALPEPTAAAPGRRTARDRRLLASTGCGAHRPRGILASPPSSPTHQGATGALDHAHLARELLWCQLLQQPVRAVPGRPQTKATKVEGGWSLTGQKVWTSCRPRRRGICLARTNTGAPSTRDHLLPVDMKSEGLDSDRCAR